MRNQIEPLDSTWRRLVALLTMALILATISGIASSGVVAAESKVARDPDLDRELIAAAWRDELGAACELIAAGADVNAQDETQQSAYLVSTSEGYLGLLELTLAHGADVSSLDSYRGTGLIRSAERGHWEVVGRLLQTDIDVDHVNRLGWTALHEAIILGDGSPDYVDTVRLLVAGGVDVELPTGTGARPLELATDRDQQAVAATLRRAYSDRPDGVLEDVLLEAVADGDADGVAIALRHGARVDAKDTEGSTAYQAALRLGHDDIARLVGALTRDHRADDGGCRSGSAAVSIQAQPLEVETVRLRPRPKRGPFSMNLFEKGDFVHQQTEYWCVAASVQTMINIIEGGRADRSKAFQRRLHFQGRRLDRSGDAHWRKIAGETRWKAGLHGLGITDWAEMLNTNGFGPYAIDGARTRDRAIHRAAKAIRITGKPVGLVVWRGAHAWVMSGFTATADPALTNDFEVKKVFIQDVWYPYVSSIWGPSRPPNSAVSVARLAEDYLRYDRPGRTHPKRDGRFMLVLPQRPPDTVVH